MGEGRIAEGGGKGGVVVVVVVVMVAVVVVVPCRNVIVTGWRCRSVRPRSEAPAADTE